MDSTVLLGAEDVRAGGNAMERAADRMVSAASTIELKPKHRGGL